MRLLINILVIQITLFLSLSLYAMVVYDPAVWAQSLHTATNTYSQLKNLQQQLKIMQEQKLALTGGQYQWSNAQLLINQLGNIVQQNNALAYSSQNIDSLFKQTYPGYEAPQDYSQQYRQITATTLNTLNNVLQTLGTNANDFQDENKRLAFLQQQEQNSDNQLKAIQAASQIASEQVTQTQLLRQTMIAQTNAQTMFYASQVQNEASSRAELEKIISNGERTAPAIGHSGHVVTLPDFDSYK